MLSELFEILKPIFRRPHSWFCLQHQYRGPPPRGSVCERLDAKILGFPACDRKEGVGNIPRVVRMDCGSGCNDPGKMSRATTGSVAPHTPSASSSFPVSRQGPCGTFCSRRPSGRWGIASSFLHEQMPFEALSAAVFKKTCAAGSTDFRFSFFSIIALKTPFKKEAEIPWIYKLSALYIKRIKMLQDALPWYHSFCNTILT